MKLFFSLILGMILFSGAALAAMPDGTPIDNATVAPLMRWVEQQTGVKVPVLPQVIASHRELALALDAADETPMGRARSAYMPGTVVLDNLRWDSEDEVQVSLLVHELVHHAQLFMKHAHWACPRCARGAGLYAAKQVARPARA